MLKVVFSYCSAQCHYAECCYAERRYSECHGAYLNAYSVAFEKLVIQLHNVFQCLT
jgi:hypothetical protein